MKQFNQEFVYHTEIKKEHLFPNHLEIKYSMPTPASRHTMGHNNHLPWAHGLQNFTLHFSQPIQIRNKHITNTWGVSFFLVSRYHICYAFSI